MDKFYLVSKKLIKTISLSIYFRLNYLSYDDIYNDTWEAALRIKNSYKESGLESDFIDYLKRGLIWYKSKYIAASKNHNRLFKKALKNTPAWMIPTDLNKYIELDKKVEDIANKLETDELKYLWESIFKEKNDNNNCNYSINSNSILISESKYNSSKVYRQINKLKKIIMENDDE